MILSIRPLILIILIAVLPSQAVAFHTSTTAAPAPSSASAGDEFRRDLYFGLRNDSEVVRLQEFLREEGFFTYPQSTGNFFAVTLNAVASFQQSHGLRPAAGYFGPITRAKANSILSGREAEESMAPPTPSPDGTPPVSDTSTWYGAVQIIRLSGKSSDPANETVVLQNKNKSERIDITGWRIETLTGQSFEIPLVHNLPGFYTVASDRLLLPAGGKVTISAGKQERRLDFRENLCTGYFAEFSDFNPSLSRSCPKLDTKLLSQFYNDRCIKTMERIRACTTPDSSHFFGIDSACSNFITANFSYVGCVRNFRHRNDFYENHWIVWMQREREFLRNTHDTVSLIDTSGKLVDARSY